MQNSENKPTFQVGDKVVYKDGSPIRLGHEYKIVQSVDGSVVSYTDGSWDFAEELTVFKPYTPKPTYKIIERLSAGALSAAVNAAILEGFKPIGGVSMSEHRHYMQAMLKE